MWVFIPFNGLTIDIPNIQTIKKELHLNTEETGK